MENLTHFRTCNLCEAMCGLEIKVENSVVIKIEGASRRLAHQEHQWVFWALQCQWR